MSAPDARSVDPRAVVVLAGAAALACVASVDGSLLPHVERAPARALGLACAVGFTALGAWLGARLARDGCGRALAMAAGGLAALGCWWASEVVAPSHDALLASLAEPGGLHYHAQLILAVARPAAPACLSIGLAWGLVQGSTKVAGAAGWVGVAAALGVAPWLADGLLGHAGLLRVSAVLVAGAALVAGERGPLTPASDEPDRGRRWTEPLALLVAGVAASALLLRLVPVAALGSLTTPWFCAAFAAGAAVGQVARRKLSVGPLALLPAFALPLALPDVAPARSLDPPGLATALALVVCLGGLSGLGVGLGTSSRRPAAWQALWLVLPAMASWRALFPALGVTGALLALAPVLLLAVWFGAPRAPTRTLVGALVLAVVCARLPLPVPEGVPAARSWTTPDGVLAVVAEPGSGRERLAIHGRAPLGRSAEQDARLVHLPLLLPEEAAERVLVVALDEGDAAAAALAHRPGWVDWLCPVSLPQKPDLEVWPFVTLAEGSERLFLATPRPEFDVMVLAPELRPRARVGRLATVEFYAEARERLAEGGLFCQWWDPARVDVGEIKSALASAARVFGHTWTILDHPRSRRPLIGLLACDDELPVDPGRIDAHLAARPTVREQLSGVGLDGLGVACLLLQSPGLLSMLAPDEHAVDDGRPTLGVRAALRPLPQPLTLLAGVNTFTRRRSDPMSWIEVVPRGFNPMAVHVRDVLRAWQPLLGGAQTVVARDGPEAPPFEWLAPGEASDVEADGFLQALAVLPDWPWLQELVLAHARWLEQGGRAADAERYLKRALDDDIDPASPVLRAALAAFYERHGQHDRALVLWRTVLAFDAGHPQAQAAVERLGG